MLRNSQSFAIPVYAGVASNSFKSLLSNQFETQSAEETIEMLSVLLQSWISPDAGANPNNLDISNMVFSVTNLNTFILKLAGLHFNNHLCIDEKSETRLLISKFFDSFGFDYPTERLLEALHSWIYFDEYHSIDLKKVADVVSLFGEIGKLVQKLEESNKAFELEGGELCAY
jgi:hypothetical protein